VQQLKFFIYYAPDDDPSLNRRKQQLVADIGQQCADLNLRYLMEPLVYHPTIQPGTLEYAQIKPDLVRRATELFAEPRFNADVLKVEVPVDLKFVEGFGEPQRNHAQALDAFRDAAAPASDLELVYLSAGVSFEWFESSLKLAVEAGVKFNGFMCGRALWSDAVEIFGNGGESELRNWLQDGVSDRKLTIGLIRASLPSYFPEKYDVWSRAEKALSALCDEESATLFIAPDIPMDAKDTRKALDDCAAAGADFILLLHGGFSMGDVARTIAAAPVRAGFWSVPEPIRTGDVQLNNFVSLNMSMSIARLVRDLSQNPVQWYHGAPESAALVNRLRTTLKALTAVVQLERARIGVIGGLAMTFYNMEVSTNELRSRTGVEVANHDMHELTQRMDAIDKARVSAELALIQQAATVEGVSDAQMTLQSRAALAMHDISTENNYAALAVSDWPALQTYPGMHPGAAFTWLEEQYQIPVASEGDILGAVTQLVAQSITGKVGYLLDMTEPDLDAKQLLVWHGGGGPLYLADGKGSRWINHPMIGRGTKQGPIYGAIADLVFKDGPVCLFRVARDASALFKLNCTVAGRDPDGFTGVRGWLENFQMEDKSLSLEDVVNTVMMHGLEHHFILVPGDISAVLGEFGSWTGMTTLGARPARNYLCAEDFS